MPYCISITARRIPDGEPYPLARIEVNPHVPKPDVQIETWALFLAYLIHNPGFCTACFQELLRIWNTRPAPP